MRVVARLGVSGAAGVGAGIAAAVAVAVINMYLVGHGRRSITDEVITLERLGVHLSIGDVAMVVIAIAVAALTWRRS